MNCFGVRMPCSEIMPERSFSFVLSKAGLMTWIFLFCVSHTSLDDLFSILIFLVNLLETAQVYLGMLWSFASLTNVDVPILFASSFFVMASAPKRKRSHFFRDCSAARSGDMITFIFAFARSVAVCLPCNSGSTSVVYTMKFFFRFFFAYFRISITVDEWQ